MEGMRSLVIHLLVAGLGLGCATTGTRPVLHDRHAPSEREYQAIDGHIADLDLVATRASSVNSEIMTGVTADGDTYHLNTPSDVRCTSGSNNVPVHLSMGIAIRV
jgi:hypothetical protein